MCHGPTPLEADGEREIKAKSPHRLLSFLYSPHVPWSPPQQGKHYYNVIMTRFPFVLLLVTLVCIWAVAGCGGGAPTVTLTPKSARDLPTNTPVPRTYDPDPIELPDDATWLLEYLDGRPVIAATFITLRLRGDMLEGVDGCNSFASQPGDGTIIARSDGSFSTPKEIVLTLKGCFRPPGILDQADAYMSALRQAERFRAMGNWLEIYDGSGALRLVFMKQ